MGLQSCCYSLQATWIQQSKYDTVIISPFTSLSFVGPTYKYNAGPWTTIGYGPYSYCSSTATNLTSCTRYSSYYRLRYCSPQSDTVHLKCNNNYGSICTLSNCCNNLSLFIVKPTCSPNYSIRLVGGNDTSEGRLEVCYRGVWHAKCGQYNQLFASVACNQLGFTSNNCMS